MSKEEISLIERRIIEAQTIVPLIIAFGKQVGLREFGYCLSCCRDNPFVEGFNPKIKFKRTQTIMEGAPYCDFRYTLED